MKIGEPTSELPQGYVKKGKYAEVWAAVRKADGAWVPVECDDIAFLRRLQMNAGAHRHLKIETRSQDLTLYVRLRKNGATR